MSNDHTEITITVATHYGEGADIEQPAKARYVFHGKAALDVLAAGLRFGTDFISKFETEQDRNADQAAAVRWALNDLQSYAETGGPCA